MKAEIKVPAMGESISEATVGTLIKPSGAQVAADDELLELETDKVNQVLYAPQAGVVNWSVQPEDVVKIGQVIGYIDSSQQAEAPTKIQKAPPPKAAPSPTKAAEEKKAAPSMLEPAPPAPSSLQAQTRAGKEAFLAELSAAPSRQVPLPQFSSSQSSLASSATQTQSTEAGGRETRKKMSKIRKIIAARLVDVLQQTAMLTTFNEVDMTNIIALRENYKEAFAKQYDTRLGFMPFFVKASVSGMKAFPEVNAYIDGDDIVYRHYFDIGIAIGTDRGLIVPVVRNCDQLSFADIEKNIEAYAKQAREGNITASALQGGGFTVTNGGTYGSLLSTPILNPPQCAILGMHKIMKRPVVVNDQIVIRQMMYLALSYDHRIIDGKEAVSFLVHVKNCLEEPSRLLIGI